MTQTPHFPPGELGRCTQGSSRKPTYVVTIQAPFSLEFSANRNTIMSRNGAGRSLTAEYTKGGAMRRIFLLLFAVCCANLSAAPADAADVKVFCAVAMRSS